MKCKIQNKFAIQKVIFKMNYLHRKQCVRTEGGIPLNADFHNASHGEEFVILGTDGALTLSKTDTSHITLLVQLLA